MMDFTVIQLLTILPVIVVLLFLPPLVGEWVMLLRGCRPSSFGRDLLDITLMWMLGLFCAIAFWFIAAIEMGWLK